jgi:hypothetical protein
VVETVTASSGTVAESAGSGNTGTSGTDTSTVGETASEETSGGAPVGNP